MERAGTLGVARLVLQAWLHKLLAEYLWASYFPSRILCFFIQKTAVSGVCGED